jgi:hypothetical protein
MHHAQKIPAYELAELAILKVVIFPVYRKIRIDA